MASTQLAVIGLGTMGANIARNAARNGARVAIFNRTAEKTDEFMKNYGDEGTFVACHTLEELVAALKPPRPILLMVKAGTAVDDMMEELVLLLSEGDILIDAGNSLFADTRRREKKMTDKGFRFIGMGVSGGEEGALLGPSMMPGGDQAAYQILEPLFTKMAADDGAGGKCISFMGPGGAGHFVKMVHNGIEYGIMQLIAEIYDLLRSDGMSAEEVASVFEDWSKSETLQSFLVEITAHVLHKKDDETGDPLVDILKDAAGQKGTGKWTVSAAMDLGVAIPTITAAVEARILSAHPEERARWNRELPEALPEPYAESKALKDMARSALELSVIAAYVQGFALLEKASEEHEWQLPCSEIARIWRGGCIIRSALLPWFQDAFSKDDAKRAAARVRLIDRYRDEAQVDWRRLIAIATGRGIPVAALSATLAYYDVMRRAKLPQNLIQAQRDFFGAHGYERRDREGTFHTKW